MSSDAAPRRSIASPATNAPAGGRGGGAGGREPGESNGAEGGDGLAAAKAAGAGDSPALGRDPLDRGTDRFPPVTRSAGVHEEIRRLIEHPVLQRLQDEFGPPRVINGGLRWVLLDATDPSGVVVMLVAPMQIEGWVEVLVTFETHRGRASMRLVMARPGFPLLELIELLRGQTVPVRARG